MSRCHASVGGEGTSALRWSSTHRKLAYAQYISGSAGPHHPATQQHYRVLGSTGTCNLHMSVDLAVCYKAKASVSGP